MLDTTATEICRLSRERNLSFFPSAISHGEQPKRAIFFYHCPKTGGMTINHALQHALACLSAVQQQNLFLGRVDDINVPPGKRVAKPSAFVATHLPFGAHRKIGQEFDLITVLRDPVARVVSGYTYTCMRQDKKPDPGEFREYLALPENVNGMVRQLSGSECRQTLGDADLKQAIENLQRHFVIYVTTGHIPSLISAYLSRFRAPNVLMENANQTLSEYKMDHAPFDEEIRHLNALDMALFDFVRDSPRLNDVHSLDECVSPMTLFVDEVEKRAATVTHAYCHKTEKVPELLESSVDALRQITWS